MNIKKNFIIVLLLLVSLCILYRCSPSSDAIFVEKIPIEVYSSAIVVPVVIAGKTYNFQLDTGAPTTISPQIFSDLGLAITDSINGYDYYGNTAWAKNTPVPAMQIGKSSFSHIKSSVIRPIQWLQICDERIDGYLGSTFLSDKVLMIDIKNKVITITNLAPAL